MQALRQGTWLTQERLRNYAALMLCMTVGTVAYLFFTAQGTMDQQGRPLGTDFSNVYAAGTYVREGHADAPYDPARQLAREEQLFGADTPFYGWHYPPFFLMIASALAALPYLAALAVWQLVTLALYLRSLWLVLPQRAMLLPALGFPAVMVNLTHGHNGFLTAALLAAGLHWLKPRPVLAGICLGLLAYKPQFGVMIPLALLAGGYWKTIASASATVLVLIGTVTLLYGMRVWDAFAASLPFTRYTVLEQGDTGFEKIQSLFAAVRLLGGSVETAYAAQGALLLALAVSVVMVWRSRVAEEISYSLLGLACLLATPYSLDYDLMVLAVPLAWMARHGLREGFAPYQITFMTALWAMPLVTRSVGAATHLALGVVAMLVAYGWLIARWRALRLVPGPRPR